MNLQNLVDYCHEYDLPDPFSGASVPEPLNIDSVKSAIMIRCGLLTPVFNDPYTFTNVVTQWFDQKQWTFDHIVNIIESEYSPIENVFEERTEETAYGHTNTKTGGYKDTEGGKDTVKDSGKDTVADSGSDTTEASGTDERDITNSGTDTTTNTISAFNASTYQPDNQSETSHGHAVDDDITYGKSEETTYGKQTDTTYGKQTDTTFGHNVERVYNSEKDTQSGKDTLTVKRHGNVGVTSADELILQELNLLRHFDAYGFIAELFEKDNMIMIY